MAETSARIPEKGASNTDAQLRFAASAVIGAIVAGAIYFAPPVLPPLPSAKASRSASARGMSTGRAQQNGPGPVAPMAGGGRTRTRGVVVLGPVSGLREERR